LPIAIVRYPAPFNACAIVISDSGKNASLPGPVLPGIPHRTGYRPVNNPARDGEHTDAAA
jgi:hypothetical protein